MNKQQLSVVLTPTMKKALEKLPQTATATLTQAINHARRNPHLLSRALAYRLDKPFEANSCRVAMRTDKSIVDDCEKLAQMSKLPVEQVLRLALEAMVYRL